MNTAMERLNAIEARAERAIVQELRQLLYCVQQLRPALSPADREHADALLLKLAHRIDDALVPAAPPRRPRSEAAPRRA